MIYDKYQEMMERKDKTNNIQLKIHLLSEQIGYKKALREVKRFIMENKEKEMLFICNELLREIDRIKLEDIEK